MRGVIARWALPAFLLIAGTYPSAAVAAASDATTTNIPCGQKVAVTSSEQSPPAGGATTGGKSPSLTSSGPATPINVGGGEGAASTDVVLSASPALPSNITPQQISIEVPQRFRRSNDKQPTQFLRDPTFSTPRILENRKVISYQLCFDASDVSAGSYVGQVVTSAPGIEPATVAVTLNAQDEALFWWLGLAAIFVAFGLLYVQAAQTEWKAQDAKTKDRLKKAFSKPPKDFFGFWMPSVVAIIAAAVAMYGVFDADPAWGADIGASVIALVGTALAAAGLGTLLSGFKKG